MCCFLSILGVAHGSKLDIFESATSKNISIEFEDNETVRDLKVKIKSITGVPENEQRLIWAGSQPDNDYFLTDLVIPDEFTFTLERRQTPNMKLVVKYQTLWNLTLDFHTSDIIGDLKNKINDIKQIPQDEQRMTFGKLLIDNRSLSSYNITNGSVLNFIKRTPGC